MLQSAVPNVPPAVAFSVNVNTIFVPDTLAAKVLPAKLVSLPSANDTLVPTIVKMWALLGV